MRLTPKDPPRRFTVGHSIKREMVDTGMLELNHDEQITLVTESGAEYDVARKDWGFYATPSLNGRLESFGLRGVLIRNRVSARFFVLLVERGCEAAFERYLNEESCEIVVWLDSSDALEHLRAEVSAS